jgi:hypothetical protein
MNKVHLEQLPYLKFTLIKLPESNRCTSMDIFPSHPDASLQMMHHPVALLVLCLLHAPVYVLLPVGAPVLPIPASPRVPQFAAAPVLVALIVAVAPS